MRWIGFLGRRREQMEEGMGDHKTKPALPTGSVTEDAVERLKAWARTAEKKKAG